MLINTKTDNGLYISEDNKSIYLNHSVTPTVVPEERLTSTVADNETIHTMEEKTPTPSSSHGENDGSGDMLDQNTQPPTMTAEPTTKSDDLSTKIHAGETGGDNEKHITIIPSLDSNGSGMGEPTHSTTSESDTGDSVSTGEDGDKYIEVYFVHPVRNKRQKDFFSMKLFIALLGSIF